MEDGGILPVLVENRTGYRNLCELLTHAHLRSEKGKCAIQWDELPQFAQGLVAFFNASLLSFDAFRSANCRASVSDANLSRRFTEWSRGDASDMDGQPVRASER